MGIVVPKIKANSVDSLIKTGIKVEFIKVELDVEKLELELELKEKKVKVFVAVKGETFVVEEKELAPLAELIQ